MEIKMNTKKQELESQLAYFKEDCLKGLKLDKKQKHALEYFIQSLNQLIK